MINFDECTNENKIEHNFQKESFRVTCNKTMTIEDQIKDEKLQYDINREAAKISALSSGKIYKYEYLTGEEILPSNQQQIIEQAKFTYFPLGKAFEKQTKTIEDQGDQLILIIMMIIKINYYFQRKEESLKIFTIKDLKK